MVSEHMAAEIAVAIREVADKYPQYLKQDVVAPAFLERIGYYASHALGGYSGICSPHDLDNDTITC